ncbi:hypothetical protein ACQPXT_24180 [Streptomyces sp. CA-100214]
MTNTSRRNVLTFLAASAATVPLAGAAGASPARAAGQGAAAPAVAPAALTAARSSVTTAPLGPDWFAHLTLASRLTATVLPGTPARTEVTSGGRRVALLTHGARTVVLTGPQRTFTENKKPFVDDFVRTLPDPALPAADRAYWGTSPGGGSWSTLGPVDADYSVRPGPGPSPSAPTTPAGTPPCGTTGSPTSTCAPSRGSTRCRPVTPARTPCRSGTRTPTTTTGPGSPSPRPGRCSSGWRRRSTTPSPSSRRR